MSDAPTTHLTLLKRLTDETDGVAWQEFCRRYSRLILGFARRRGLQPSDCDDVLQEVLAELSRAMPDFCYDPSRGRFRGFLKTVSSRLILRKFCQKRHPASQLEDVGSATPDEGELEQLWEDEWRQHHLRQAMKAIAVEFNSADRAAFEAYVVEGRSVADVTSSLELSASQVYQAKSRILKRLTELIEKQISVEG